MPVGGFPSTNALMPGLDASSDGVAASPEPPKHLPSSPVWTRTQTQRERESGTSSRGRVLGASLPGDGLCLLRARWS